MLHRASPAPRGPRNSSPSVRGRGGIQKRKAGPTRTDRDGDLVMDATTTGDKRRSGRGHLATDTSSRGQSSRRGRGGPTRGDNAGLIKAQSAIIRGLNARDSQATVLESLQIDGLGSSKAASNPDGGVESLLAFLERKASAHDPKAKPVKIKKSLRKGDSVIISASPEDVLSIQKLSGFSFAGAELSIKPCDSPPARLEKPKDEVSKSAQETKELLRTVLATRYDANLKLLNLAALAQDPGLIQMGFFDGNTTKTKIFPALMVVCDGLFKTRTEKREAIVSVTLADNDLTDVTDVEALARTFPDIKNLDLSRNKITQLSSFNAWGSRLRDLTTLILNGNPIEPLLPTLKSDLVKKFPRLEILNGIQFRTPEEIATALEAAKYPIPLQVADFRDVAQVGETFIRQFVVLYDTNRSALLTNFYDAESTLSIAINMTAPRDPKQGSPIPPWAAYTKFSRNLVKINNLPTQMSRLHRGSQAINTVWSSLPATRHPDLQTQPEKYIIECHPLPGLVDPNGQSPHGVDGLIITMHGEFEEANDKPGQALRSFSRTFVLGPGGSGGPVIRVISDMMTLRAWGPLPVPRPTMTPAAVPIVTPALTEQQKQEAFAQQLVQKTGLNLQYAILCLTETGWDLEKAFAAFNDNRHRLPVDAFANSYSQ